jgi:GNAT superfamily N-acetyltransferase
MTTHARETPGFELRLAESDEDLRRCYPTMVQLRTHLTEDGFVEQAQRQRRDGGYRVLMLEDAGRVRALAGFRVFETTFSGRMLYVDDLVTDADSRSRGHGRALLEWLAEYGRKADCRTLELDSGVQRFAAHHFYFREGMRIVGYHFRRALQEPQQK